MTASLSNIMKFLEDLAPSSQALEWDNVGLQVGDPSLPVNTILLALDMTRSVLEEAIDISANLVITHHPLIFRPLRSINFQTPVGRIIRNLVLHKVSLYTMHTNFDLAHTGTGWALCELLGLQNIAPYVEDAADEMNMVMTGRFNPPLSSDEVIALIKEKLGNPAIRAIGEFRSTTTVAVIPGSGGSLIRKLHRPIDLIITGEISYHDALDADALGQAVISLGHFVSEKPAMYNLQKILIQNFPDLSVQVAQTEGEPYVSL